MNSYFNILSKAIKKRTLTPLSWHNNRQHCIMAPQYRTISHWDCTSYHLHGIFRRFLVSGTQIWQWHRDDNSSHITQAVRITCMNKECEENKTKQHRLKTRIKRFIRQQQQKNHNNNTNNITQQAINENRGWDVCCCCCCCCSASALAQKFNSITHSTNFNSPNWTTIGLIVNWMTTEFIIMIWNLFVTLVIASLTIDISLCSERWWSNPIWIGSRAVKICKQ